MYNVPQSCTMYHNHVQCTTNMYNVPQSCTMYHNHVQCTTNKADITNSKKKKKNLTRQSGSRFTHTMYVSRKQLQLESCLIVFIQRKALDRGATVAVCSRRWMIKVSASAFVTVENPVLEGALTRRSLRIRVALTPSPKPACLAGWWAKEENEQADLFVCY